jgi:hypothetical protein
MIEKLPGAPMPLPRLRAELFTRYGLDWEFGVPPGGKPTGGTTQDTMLRWPGPAE